MRLSVLKRLPLTLSLSLSTLSIADVISPEELLNKGFKALPTFEAVASIDHQSNKIKSAADLKEEDFNSLNIDPLFQAISKLQFSYKISAKSQECLDNSTILTKTETVLSHSTLLDKVQESGVMVININVLNNLSAKIDDSNLKASAFVGSTKNFKREKDPALNINLILKKDGTCYSPSANEIKGAINAI